MHFSKLIFVPVALAAFSGCSGGESNPTGTGGTGGSGGDSTGSASSGGATETLGAPHEGGQYHLGPVDYAETQFHNACAPGGGYAPAVQVAEGDLLAGLWNGIPDVAQYCDACILVTTKLGKSALLRVVTYGDTTPNSIDVSQSAYALLDQGEFPREMTWQFAKCNDTGKIMYEFQTGSSEWWTSLWVRNATLPIAKVEVKSMNHADFVALDRAGDGTLTDASGFGKGDFTFRITSIDGKQVTETFPWPADTIAGKMLTGTTNF